MKRFLDCEMEIKKQGNGIIIEGYANAATVDRMNERIDPSGWNLDNYKKNPIVLFDHGHDPQFGTMPIGKAVDVAADDKGLYAKIKLSNSKTEKISAVRDLVEEGILKTFSVGFAPKDRTKSEDGSHTVITAAELIECSVVPVPMNQDSTFSLLGKRSVAPSVKKWLKARMELETAKQKGAWLAMALHQRLLEAKDRDQLIKDVADEASVTVDVVHKCLAGFGATSDLVAAFASVLGIDKALLENIKGLELPPIVGGIINKGEDHGESKESKKSEEGSEEDQEGSEEVIEPSKVGELTVLAIMVPKAVAENEDAAKAACEAQGYKAESCKEDGDMWHCGLVPSEETDLANSSKLSLPNGLVAMVGPKVSKKPAEKSATEKMEHGDTEGLGSPEDLKVAFEADVQATEKEGEGNPASWVTNEALWEKAKKASIHALGEIKWAFVAWWYLNHLNEGSKSSEVNETKNMIGQGEQDQNPYLHEARQTNVLLGSLIHEIKLLSSKLTGQVEKPTEPEQPEEVETNEPEEAESEEAMKAFNTIQTTMVEVKSILKRLKEMA